MIAVCWWKSGRILVTVLDFGSGGWVVVGGIKKLARKPNNKGLKRDSSTADPRKQEIPERKRGKRRAIRKGPWYIWEAVVDWNEYRESHNPHEGGRMAIIRPRIIESRPAALPAGRECTCWLVRRAAAEGTATAAGRGSWQPWQRNAALSLAAGFGSRQRGHWRGLADPCPSYPWKRRPASLLLALVGAPPLSGCLTWKRPEPR